VRLASVAWSARKRVNRRAGADRREPNETVRSSVCEAAVTVVID
jgi:hypothetical protein